MKALTILLAMSTLAQAAPADHDQVTRFEFNCKGLRDVVFKQNGDLTINGKTYRLEGGHMDMLFFDNKVTLQGELDGEELFFDKSQIVYGGKSYECIVE